MKSMRLGFDDDYAPLRTKVYPFRTRSGMPRLTASPSAADPDMPAAYVVESCLLTSGQ